MNIRDRKILDIVARDIQSLLIPAIDSPSAKASAAMMSTLLRRIAHASAESALEPLSASDAPSLDALMAWGEAQEKIALSGDDVTRESLFDQSGSGKVGTAATKGAVEPITSENLLPYLRKMPEFKWVQQASVKQASGGFSKDTFIASLTGDGRDQQIVLRRDDTLRPLETSVTDEAGILRTLATANYPVPMPLFVESSAFGVPVMATSCLAGNSDHTHWASDPESVNAIVLQAAKLLARLHAFPLSEVSNAGSGVPGSVGETPGAIVGHLREFWERIRTEENPLMEAVLDWLAANAPATFGRHTIVHGDFGFHNLLVDNGVITGLLDWEFWHIGDAYEDLAYARSFVERVAPWSEFVAAYEREGGVAPNPDVERFYSVLGTVRIAAGCFALIHALDTTPELIDAKRVYVGQSSAFRFLLDAAKAIQNNA